MSCDHLIRRPDDQAHILPCRHKFCIPCTASIEGLMESDIFACPLCGNYSQYVDPRRKVFGEEKLAENEYERMDFNTSSHSMPETVRADSYGGAATTTYDTSARRSTSERGDYRDPDRNINAWMAEKGVQKQTFEIEQREAWEKIEKDKQDKPYKRQSTTDVSPASQVSTLAMNDARRHTSEHRSGDFNTSRGSDVGLSERHDNYANVEKGHTSTESKLMNYDQEGRCLDHHRFIAFACKECNTLLCELCKSKHSLKYTQHTISRLTEEGQRNVPPKMTADAIEASTVNNDQGCKYHHMPCIMYCKGCKRMLCKSCLDSHSGYCTSDESLSIRDMKKSMYKRFDEHLNTIDGLKKNFSRVSQTVEYNVNCLLEETETLKENVKRATDEAIKQLVENQALMIEQIESQGKIKTAAQQRCADEVNEITDALKIIEETAQGALKSVDDSNFAVAQVAEQDVSSYIRDFNVKLSYKKYEPPARERIPLRCEVKRIAKYWTYQGDKCEAPVRLNKPTSSYSLFNSYTIL